MTDQASWRHGAGSRFLDAGGDLCFAWEYYALRACAINRELVNESEIRNVRDLLQPKWRGKIIFSDPRLGVGLRIAASIARQAGAEVLEPLLRGQRPAIVGEARQLAEAVVEGTHPIAFGLRPKALAPFRAQGLDRKVKFLDLADADPVGSTSLLHFDRAPHPAAAQLFANWILTRDGQTALTSNLPTNSARTDVKPFADEGIATPGQRYYEPDRESNYPHNDETERLVRSLLSEG